MHDPSFSRRPGSKEEHDAHTVAELEPLGVVHTNLDNVVMNALMGGPMTIVSPRSWSGVMFHFRTSWDSATSSMAYVDKLNRRVHQRPQVASEAAAAVLGRLQTANDAVLSGTAKRGDKALTKAHWAVLGGFLAFFLLLLVAYFSVPESKAGLVFPAGIFALFIGVFFFAALQGGKEKVVEVPMLNKRPRDRIRWEELTPKQWSQARAQVFEAMFEDDSEREEFVTELREAARTAGITAHDTFKASPLAYPVKKFLGGEVSNGNRPEKVAMVEFLGTRDGDEDTVWCYWDGTHFFYYFRPKTSSTRVTFSVGGVSSGSGNRRRNQSTSKSDWIHLA